MHWRAIGLLLLLACSLFFYARAMPPTLAQKAPSFQKIWGDGGPDYATGVAVDRSSNVYTTGSSSYGPHHALLLKYDNVGNLVWHENWVGSSVAGGSIDYAYAISVDSLGNVYLTGYTFGYLNAQSNNPPLSSLQAASFLVKFDSSGNSLWQKIWNISNAYGGYTLTVDHSDDIYVACGPTLLKFDSSGDLLWRREWGSYNSGIQGMAVDSLGNVDITGSANRNLGPGYGWYVLDLLQYNSTGSLLWQKTLNSRASDGTGLAVDSLDNIYVTGATNSSSFTGPLLLKLDSSGNLLWANTWGAPGNGGAGEGVVVDSSDDLYFLGLYPGVTLFKLDPLGDLLRQWNASGDKWGLNGIAVDAEGNAVAVGTAVGPPPYNIYSPKFAMRTAPLDNSELQNSTFTPTTPPISVKDVTGTVQTAPGSETYTGGDGVIVMNFVAPTITFLTCPETVGSIDFNGTTKLNGQSGDYNYGNYTAAANDPLGYQFAGWNSTGGIIVQTPTKTPSNVTLNGSGTLTANFTVVGTILPPCTPLQLDTSTGGGGVRITWKPPLHNGGAPISQYKIYRGAFLKNGTSIKNRVLLVAVHGANTNYRDTNVTLGQRYYYCVTALNSAGESSCTSPRLGIFESFDSGPLYLTLTAGNGTIVLKWTEPFDTWNMPITGYKVYRGTNATSEEWLNVTVGGTSYTDTGLLNGQTYYYSVSAINSFGEGPHSPMASAIPLPPLHPPVPVTIPSAPPGIRFLTNATIVPNTFRFNNQTTKTLNFNATGPHGSIGITNITLPKSLVGSDTNITIYIDGKAISNATITSDATNFYIYFTITFSTHRVSLALSVPTPPFNWVPIAAGATLLIIIAGGGIIYLRLRRPRKSQLGPLRNQSGHAAFHAGCASTSST